MGMSQISISKRLITGKFTHAELEKMASIMGYEYHSIFIFLDGNCYSAFYLKPNHATLYRIKKRHSINYSDGFFIRLLYAVPLCSDVIKKH